MTNYERIRAMTIEEMTDFLDKSDIGACDVCAFRDMICKVDEECHEAISEWLKREASDALN